MFTGQRYRLALNGSFNGSQNLLFVPPGDFTVGSRNANTHNGGAEKRGGTQKVGSQVASGVASLGGGQLIKRSTGTKHIYFAGNDGKLYRDGASIEASRSTTAKTHFTPANDAMFICNGVSSMRVDTGSAIADVTAASADWTGTTHPKKVIVHNKGASRRAFAWGVQGKETTLYYSSLGAFQTFTGGTSGTVFVDIKDGAGIIDCVSKDGVLWIFGKRETFYLVDDSTDVSTWGVQKASFVGGVHSPRLTCVANNQIFAMASDGNIYEVQTAEQLRDYKQASISEPFYIHNYISENIDLTKIDDFHMAYDPKTKQVKIFVVRTGQTTVDTCLPYHALLGRWATPHDGTDNAANGYRAAAAFQVEVGVGDDRLYTQDYNGFTWKLEDTTKTDDGSAYTFSILSPWLDFDLPGEEKRFPYLILEHLSQGDYQVDIKWYIDGIQQTTETVTLASTGATLGTFVLNTDALSVTGITNTEASLGQVGRRFRIEITNDGAGEDVFLSDIIIPFIPRGIRRQ